LVAGFAHQFVCSLRAGSATQLDGECDDGNLTDGDGCSASCLRE
jgi:cysteine-rich repeat protein